MYYVFCKFKHSAFQRNVFFKSCKTQSNYRMLFLIESKYSAMSVKRFSNQVKYQSIEFKRNVFRTYKLLSKTLLAICVF